MHVVTLTGSWYLNHFSLSMLGEFSISHDLIVAPLTVKKTSQNKEHQFYAFKIQNCTVRL